MGMLLAMLVSIFFDIPYTLLERRALYALASCLAFAPNSAP